MEVNARLEQAIRRGNARMAREALRRGADANLRIGREGQSALYCAALSGNIDVAKALLEAGAKLAGRKGNGSALHAAAEAGDVEMVRLMLKAGGDRLLDRFDEMQRTPLMCAVEAGSLEVARELLGAGADVNARDDSGPGNTALRIAAGEGTLEMVKLLMAAGADPLIPGRLTLTPLDRARERHTPEGRLITAHMLRVMEEAKAAKKAVRQR